MPATRALAEVWNRERLMPLGKGTPECAFRDKLQRLSVDELFAPNHVRRPELAQACLAGLWLWHDFLDESHRISQDLDGPEGSFWHAIMHRREGDFWNSKYWFRRVGRHPIFESLARAASEATGPTALFQGTWDPLAFVDLCERAAREAGETESLCRLAQRAEWELLFEFCWQHALADPASSVSVEDSK